MFSAGYDASLARIASRIDLRAEAMRLARGVARRVVRRSARLQRLVNSMRRKATAMSPVPVARAGDFAHLLEVPVESSLRREKPRVVLSIGSLSAGGAERQLAAFAAARATAQAIEPVLLLVHEPEGHYGHYAPLVRDAGVAIRAAGASVDASVLARLRADRALADRLASLPSYLRPYVVEMAGEFLSLRPDCVHAWLDHQNIWSGVAALAVGVPHVVLSTRNVNPSNFPYLDQPWFREWYQLLARSPRVTLVNNSRAGAADYAAWMGVPASRFRVVLNGIDPEWIRRPARAEVDALRAELGGGRRLLVGGVFRLSEEKQPLVWLEAVRRIARARGDVAFFHAGEGMLADRFAAAARDLVDSGTLRILGRRGDIPALLASSDALLHAAMHEGTPNVLLEAAHLGCPVVATTAGGSPDAVAHGSTGLLCEPSDLDALAGNLAAVLGDDALRARFAAAGPAWITERFSLDRMVDETLACYPFLAARR